MKQGFSRSQLTKENVTDVRPHLSGKTPLSASQLWSKAKEGLSVEKGMCGMQHTVAATVVKDFMLSE